MEDVLQQTYVDAFLDLKCFVPNGRGSFPAWLTSLAKCNLIDALRMLEADKRGRDCRAFEPRTPEESFLALQEMIGTTRSTPSRQVARDEACTALRRAVRRLPDAYRQVVHMYDLENRTVEEVARRLSRSPGAVFMLRARAHRRLREIMGRASQYLSYN